MDERGIVDQSALRMRAGTFAAGVWLSYVVVAAASLYLALTWDRPHRLALSVLYGVGLARRARDLAPAARADRAQRATGSTSS